MSKTELVEFVAAKAGLTKADALRALDAAIEGITKGLKEDGKVALVGFGTFTAKNRDAREGINPLTKETIKIPAKVVAGFKAGSKLIFFYYFSSKNLVLLTKSKHTFYNSGLSQEAYLHLGKLLHP